MNSNAAMAATGATGYQVQLVLRDGKRNKPFGHTIDCDRDALDKTIEKYKDHHHFFVRYREVGEWVDINPGE